MLPALVARPGLQAAADRTDGAATVLRAVLDRGPLGRTAIAGETGLSAAAVSRHSADLLAMGLVWQPPEPAQRPRPGRPRIPLDINTSHHVAAGVHVALPRLTFSLTDLRGRVVASEHLPRAERSGAVLAEVAERLPGFLRRHAYGRSVLGLGVVTGGWVDPEAGVVVENAALGWRNVPVRDALRRAVRLPVHVEGHARALARAEMLFGRAGGEGVLVHLFVGNAVDAAIATGGVLLQGRRHGAGGIAHLPVPGSAQPCPCGRTGCLQVTVADRAMVERAVAEGVVPGPDLRSLLRAAAAPRRPCPPCCGWTSRTPRSAPAAGPGRRRRPAVGQQTRQRRRLAGGVVPTMPYSPAAACADRCRRRTLRCAAMDTGDLEQRRRSGSGKKER